VIDRAGQVLAVFTDNARTVRLTGPNRVFAEAKYTSAKVNTNAWIRLAPQEWRAGAEKEAWFGPWLADALDERGPDVLAVAFEYVYGAQPLKNGDGLQHAGDAAFGPLSSTDVDGRAENSDFYDYLGVSWTFGDGTKESPSSNRIRSLDCSGFLRMVYGYRMGYPLLGTNVKGPGIPRRAYAIAEFGPGVQLVPNSGKQVRELGLLQPGDLLFFHGSPEIDRDGPATTTHIEHSGMYLGIDDRGHHRFISSRVTANGPTMGDAGGESILDGTGHFAKKLRTMRRL
jgi:cell wall-associated NlpC family hydrolase